MVLGILRLIVFVLDTALWIPVILLASLADRNAKLAYRIAQYWVWVNVKLCASRIEVQGLEHLDPRAPYVFMSNHRSNFDVLALVIALWDFQLRWVAKQELARIPGFGWALRATGQVIVNRANHVQALASLAVAKKRLQDGISVVFFPEGTRSADGMLPFKKGGFIFAIETATPVVPIGISGSASILPRCGWLVRSGGEVRVRICQPIFTDHISLDQRDTLLAEVRQAIEACVDGDGHAVDNAGHPRAEAARRAAPAGQPGGWAATRSRAAR